LIIPIRTIPYFKSAGYLLEYHDLPVRDHLLSELNNTLQQFGTVKTGMVTLDNGLVTVDSAKSVDSTVHDLEAELQARGLIVCVQGATTGAYQLGYVTVVATPKTGDKACQMGKLFR